MQREVEIVEKDIKFDVAIVLNNGTYETEVNNETIQLMLQADIVTIRNKSLRVSEVEVTDSGKVRFHGDEADLNN
jgi:hypothetical protein